MQRFDQSYTKYSVTVTILRYESRRRQSVFCHLGNTTSSILRCTRHASLLFYPGSVLSYLGDTGGATDEYNLVHLGHLQTGVLNGLFDRTQRFIEQVHVELPPVYARADAQQTLEEKGGEAGGVSCCKVYVSSFLFPQHAKRGIKQAVWLFHRQPVSIQCVIDLVSRSKSCNPMCASASATQNF